MFGDKFNLLLVLIPCEQNIILKNKGVFAKLSDPKFIKSAKG